MGKIFKDETIKLVWDMITEEKLMLREVAKQLDTTTDVINKIYAAGYRRFGSNTYRNRVNNTREKKMERPAAVYSNKQFIETI
jgi:hypothetical protein